MPDLSQVISFCLHINITREACERCVHGEKGRRKSGRWLADHISRLFLLSLLPISLPQLFLDHLQINDSSSAISFYFFLPPNFFWPCGPQFGPKIRGRQPPQNPPLDPPLQHNLVPLRASWLLSFLLAIILYYWCHFLNITTVLQIWSMLRVAYYEKLAEEFVPISHGEIFLMNDDKFYLNEWMDTFI